MQTFRILTEIKLDLWEIISKNTMEFIFAWNGRFFLIFLKNRKSKNILKVCTQHVHYWVIFERQKSVLMVGKKISVNWNSWELLCQLRLWQAHICVSCKFKRVNSRLKIENSKSTFREHVNLCALRKRRGKKTDKHWRRKQTPLGSKQQLRKIS